MSDRLTMNGKPVFQVPANTIINFDSAFKHKLLCDGPAFSTGSACAYSCSFCYVPDLLRKLRAIPAYAQVKGEHEDIVIRRENPIQTIKRQLATGKGAKLAGEKLTIYASPLVDVAANMDLVQETIECCREILDRTQWDIRLLSKSHLLPKIADGLYQTWASHRVGGVPKLKSRMIFGVSTGTLDDNLAKAFEEGTPLVSKRLASLHWLQDQGYRTFGMICPSLPQTGYRDFALAMSQAIRSDRCEHVWAEVLNVRGESMTRTLRALVDGGHEEEANRLEEVSTNKPAWEKYARDTFSAHAIIYPPGKLRFLQYVTAASKPWWKSQEPRGAVLL